MRRLLAFLLAFLLATCASAQGFTLISSWQVLEDCLANPSANCAFRLDDGYAQLSIKPTASDVNLFEKRPLLFPGGMTTLAPDSSRPLGSGLCDGIREFLRDTVVDAVSELCQHDPPDTDPPDTDPPDTGGRMLDASKPHYSDVIAGDAWNFKAELHVVSEPSIENRASYTGLYLGEWSGDVLYLLWRAKTSRSGTRWSVRLRSRSGGEDLDSVEIPVKGIVGKWYFDASWKPGEGSVDLWLDGVHLRTLNIRAPRSFVGVQRLQLGNPPLREDGGDTPWWPGTYYILGRDALTRG